MDRTKLANHFVAIRIKGRRKDDLRSGWARDDYVVAGKKFVRLLPLVGGEVKDEFLLFNPDSIEEIDVLFEPTENEEYHRLYCEHFERKREKEDPKEIVEGGLSWAGQSISLRMMENRLINMKADADDLLEEIRRTGKAPEYDPYTEEGRERIGWEIGVLVRQKDRETSFTHAILPPREVGSEELSPAVWGQAAFCPTVRAGSTSMMMDAEEKVSFFIGERYAVPVILWTTKCFKKHKAELLASNQDMLSIFRNTIALQVHTDRDRKFLELCEKAVEATGQVIVLDHVPTKEDFLAIRHPAPTGEIASPYYVLMSEAAYASCVAPDGDEVFQKSDTRPVRSHKSASFDTLDGSKLTETVLWVFSPPHLLGDNLYKGGYSVYNQWDDDVYEFRGWEFAGLGIKDNQAITKVIIKY